MQICPFPVFTDFVKKDRENISIKFFIINDIDFVKKIDNPPNAPQIRELKIIGASSK